MAQMMRLSLWLAILFRATVGEEDQSCVLQSHIPRDAGAGGRSLSKAVNASDQDDFIVELIQMEQGDGDAEVTCGDEGFYDFDFSPGAARFLERRDELVPGSGVYFLGHNAGETSTCLGGAIWTKDVAVGDDDLKQCPNGDAEKAPFCNLLVVYDDGSVDGKKINDCKEGPSTLRLRLDPPRKVVGFEAWDMVEDPEDKRDKSRFAWRDAAEGSKFTGVLIPPTGDGEGTGFVSIANAKNPPSNVRDISVRFASTGGLRSIRFCGSNPNAANLRPAVEPADSEPAPAPENQAAVVPSKVECPAGTKPYVFDFSGAVGRKFEKIGEQVVKDGPLYFAGFKSDSSSCIGAGMWTPETNKDDDDLEACRGNAAKGGCNLLVVVEKGSDLTDPIKIDDCAGGPSRIKLDVKPVQTITEFQFWDNEEKGSSFTWTSGGKTATVFLDTTKDKEGLTVDISENQDAPPTAVESIEIKYAGSGGFQSLTLCKAPPQDPGVEGDPHIQTFEGQHYLLLNQGNFDLLHINGLKTTMKTSQNLMKTVDIDWQIYSHYSGRTSFTKGLLLVDKSGGKLRQMAELTAKDCKWRTKMPGGDWEVVEKSKLFSVPDGQDFVTGMKLGLETQHLKLSMNTKQGKQNVAGLYWSCRPAHHINVRTHMMREGANDQQFVHGELGGLSKRKRSEIKKGSMLQTAAGSQLQLSDEEFSVQRRWQDLGGSDDAAAYLQAVDEPGPISHFLAACSAAEKEEAIWICRKHLSQLQLVGDQDYQDCVMDVCNGAGEVAAELAAELRVVSSLKDDEV